MQKEVLRPPLPHKVPRGKDRNAVGAEERLDGVGHVHDSHALAHEVADEARNPAPGGLVELGAHLVEHEVARTHGHHARNG